MENYFPEPPRFSVGGELATLISTCGILPNAWEAICSISNNNKESFLLKKDEDVVYLIFPSFRKEDFVYSDSRYGEYNMQNEKIFSTSLRGDDSKPALVHKGALNRFRHILENSDFKAKMQGLKEHAIIFVGHSIGGAVAALATLWFLQMRLREFNIFCITFGAPLVGNATIQEAIEREDWLDRFCHVVCKYDIVPRMYLAPYESIAKPLDAIVPHWQSKMGIDCVDVLPLCISEACRTLLNNVLTCTSTIANDYPIESGHRSPYVPFGTYMLCSTRGAVCIEDSKAVLKLLHFSMQSQEGIPFDQIAGSCISEHTDYGNVLKGVNEALLNARPFTSFVTNSSPFEFGITLELEAIGAQNIHAYFALRKAGEVKNEHAINTENLHMKLSRAESSMAELEWYKKTCKSSGLGYYDTFRQFSDQRDIHVSLARQKLEHFWDWIVEKEEKHVLPSDFLTRNKWINAGTYYRRLVEPLDIAYYYRTSKGNISYLSDGVRPHRHIVLEKWKKEKEQTHIGIDKKVRMKFAPLTQDSCFWARLEEACKALTSFEETQDRYQVMMSMKESLEFEIYVEGLIRHRSISLEVFLERSSFMKWWQQYSHIQLQSPQWRSSSPLFNFMANESWKQSLTTTSLEVTPREISN